MAMAKYKAQSEHDSCVACGVCVKELSGRSHAQGIEITDKKLFYGKTKKQEVE